MSVEHREGLTCTAVTCIEELGAVSLHDKSVGGWCVWVMSQWFE